MNTRHPGNMQIRLPRFVAQCPTEWAIGLNWHTTAHDGSGMVIRPAVGAVAAAMFAELASWPHKKRAAFLTSGMRRIRLNEDATNLPGNQRMRLVHRDSIRPAGDALKPSAP